jgi:transposase
MLNCKEYIRVCLLYEYKLGHNTVEATHNICHAIAPGAISTSTAFRWFERFRNGDESLEDEPRSGRSTKIDLTELNLVRIKPGQVVGAAKYTFSMTMPDLILQRLSTRS